MGDFHMHFSKRNKTNPKATYDHLYMTFRKDQSYRNKELTGGCQGLRGREIFYYKGAAVQRSLLRVIELFCILIVVVVTCIYDSEICQKV